jgi:dihydrofolate synthase/folylpolyglutamate synthase
MDVETSLQKLFSLHTFGIKLGLENTIKFLKHLGDPQIQLKTIHVAGSNGKGSTSSFLASILQESGYRTGLYTSPHFVRFNERIVINGKQIDDEYVAEFVSDNEKFIDEYQLTFFEVTTAMAFKYFFEKETDICTIETGLGGRLDATNVLNPLAILITSISLEHTNVLGNTIAEIASEKAAIIKNGVNVFAGILKEESKEIISQRCIDTNSRLFSLESYISEDGENVELSLGPDKIFNINPPLRGKYQKYNAALAGLTLFNTFPDLKIDQFYKGINNVVVNTGLQGRFEYFHKSPDVIFDSAHNPEGIENFLSEFNMNSNSYSNKIILFGAMRDKSIADMLKMLADTFDVLYISQIQYERAASLEELSAECQKLNINCHQVKNPAEFVTDFKTSPNHECLVVLGSMYLLGEIKQVL